MRRLGPVLATLVCLTACQDPSAVGVDSDAAAESLADIGRRVIRVAAPTGTGADRDLIAAALAQARPGDIVQFRAGTYVIGNPGDFVIPTRGLTLRGAASEDGTPKTTLFGGGGFGHESFDTPVFRLTGGDQSVQRLEFMLFGVGIYISGARDGYLVDHCTFRNMRRGLTVSGDQVSGVVIRDNRFVNVGTPVLLELVSNLRFARNRISVPEPEAVPISARPDVVATLNCFRGSCTGNVFEDNVAGGYSEGIVFRTRPDAVIRANLVRRNFFVAMQVRTESESGSLFRAEAAGGRIRGNRVVDNFLSGSDGVGVFLEGARENTIRGNTIAGLTRSPLLLPEFTSAGILVDPGSDFNRIIENTFLDNAVPDIVLQGDGNRVVTAGETEIVDEGRNNTIVQ